MTVCPICTAGEASKDRTLYDDRFAHPGAWTLLACAACGHRWLDLHLGPEAIAQLYADHYPRTAGAPAPPHRASAAAWVPPEVRVLDIGCGTGDALVHHRARGCTVRGVEADVHAVELARARGLAIDHGAFDPAAHVPESYDVVTLDQVVEHFTDPVTALRGIHTVLRPGGTVILATPNAASAVARVAGDRWIHWHAPYHLHFFTRASLAHAAERAGLAVVDVRTITQPDWLSYQWIHALTRPRPGARSRLWDPAARDPRIRALRALRFLGGERLVSHLLDRLGRGDNFVARLRK